MNSSSAAPLLTLPNEIFEEIETHIENFTDLNSLIRTSHFFYNFFRSRLYDRAVTADRRDLYDIVYEVLGQRRLDSLRLLLDHGLDVNFTMGIHGATSMLHHLCHYSDPDPSNTFPLAMLLIERGLDIEVRDCASDTALHIAAYENNFEFAKFLLEQGVNVNAKGHNGSTPLHQVCLNGNPYDDSTALIDLLVQWGADVNPYDEDGYTPLLRTREANYRVVFPALLAYGADVRAHILGKTALHLAALWFDDRDEDLAEAMLQHGADIDAKTFPGGRTPLYYAVGFRRKKEVFFMVEFLLANGADINAGSTDRNSALHAALYGWKSGQEQRDLLAMLIANGADTTVLKSYDREHLARLMEEDGSDRE